MTLLAKGKILLQAERAPAVGLLDALQNRHLGEVGPIAPSFLKAIDDWRRAESDLPSRSEAIRRLVALGLKMAALPAFITAEREAAAKRKREGLKAKPPRK